MEEITRTNKSKLGRLVTPLTFGLIGAAAVTAVGAVAEAFGAPTKDVYAFMSGAYAMDVVATGTMAITALAYNPNK